MSRQNTPAPADTQQKFSALAEDGFDLQRELDEIERLVLKSYHIPWTSITFVNEERLLAQLDRAFESLPATLQEARNVLRDRENILEQAEAYAHQIVQAAEEKATQILNENEIVRHAQQEARQLHEQAHLECNNLRQQTLQDIKQMHQQAVAECANMRADTEDYVTDVLTGLESQLGGVLETVRNGRVALSQQPQVGQPSTLPMKPNQPVAS